jgi:hypothetical protein
MIDIEIIDSPHAHLPLLIVTLDGREIARRYLNLQTAQKVREAIVERDELIKRYRAQTEAYAAANKRMWATIQSWQRQAWYGFDPKASDGEEERPQ